MRPFNRTSASMSRHALVYLCALAASCCGLTTVTANAMDLANVVDLALGHDADLAQAQAGYEAAKQARPQARAALLPQVAGGWGRSYNRIDTSGFPRTDYWQSGWTVSLSQPIFDWSKWTAYQQADYVEARGAVEFDSARQNAILRAAQTYFDELAAEDELARSADYLAAVDTHVTETRHRHAAGEATVIDLRDADTAQQQAQLQALDARASMLAKRRALEQATGQPFEPLARPHDSMPLPALAPADPDAWAAQAHDQAYPVQRQQLDVRIARLDAKKIHAEHYPVVAATAAYTPAGAAAGYSRPTTTTTAMLTVTIPLYSGGDTVARERAALALADKAEDGAIAASRQAEGAARDGYARFQLDRARVDALTRLIATARATLDATRIGYRVGTRTSVDVLRAIDTLYAAQRDLTRTRYEALVTLLQLKSLTATLTVSDIAEISRGMVPTAGNVGGHLSPPRTASVSITHEAAATSSGVMPVTSPPTLPDQAPQLAAQTIAPPAPRYITDPPPRAPAPLLPNANTAATGLADLHPLDATALQPL